MTQNARPSAEASLEFFATCLPGAEALLVDELRALGVRRVRPLNGGVTFFGAPLDAERVCLWSRLAGRVTLTVARVNAGDADLLYAGAYAVPWEDVLALGASLAVRARGTNAELRNSHFTELKLKDAVCDRVLVRRGERPEVAPKGADAVIEARVREGRATLSLDLSGESLHRRAYLDARDGDDAPAACALAAALLAAAGWGSAAVAGWGLFDAACDDGLTICEAAGVAADQAPGLVRERWGFCGWALHDEDAWADLLAEADERFERGLAALAGDTATAAGVAGPAEGAAGAGGPQTRPADARCCSRMLTRGIRRLLPESLSPYNRAAERHQREAHQFEVLNAERYTDDRNAEQRSPHEVRECDPDSADEDPHDVQQRVEASHGAFVGSHLAAERPQGEQPDAYYLQSERNAHYGKTQQYAADHILQRHEQTAENDPNDIAYYAHIRFVICYIVILSGIRTDWGWRSDIRNLCRGVSSVRSAPRSRRGSATRFR